MEISYKNRKLEKSLTQNVLLEKEHGTIRAKKIRHRITELRAASNLGDLGPPLSGPARCHELTEGGRKWHLSVDLDHPYRLIFTPDHSPVPVKKDGGLDWSQVTAVTILGVENTHGK